MNPAPMRMRANWLIAVLLVALLISVTALGTILSVNSQLDQENSAASTRLQMNEILGEAQMAIQGEIKKIDNLMADASVHLAPIGLNGTLVRADLNAMMAADPYIMDVITYDKHGVVIAAEPASYHYMEGLNLSAFDNVAQMLTTKMPLMSKVIPPIDGMPGAVLAAPVFDTDGVFIGAISALFSASEMMNGTLPQLLSANDRTFWCVQTDGIDIYDTDPAQIGMNLINGPDYKDFPQVQEIGRRLVNESTGYGTYSYYMSLSAQKMVEKECYWTTVGAHGITWRLAIVHRM